MSYMPRLERRPSDPDSLPNPIQHSLARSPIFFFAQAANRALRYPPEILPESSAVVAARAADSVGTLAIRSQGYFYVAGQYDNPADPTYMSGQMYVEYQIPDTPPKYPIILVHGGSHTGAGWQGTPDGRRGWADFFLQ